VGEHVEGEEAFTGCNLIGLTTHGYGEQHRSGLGSVTERVLSTTRLPLLIVRPPNRAHLGQ
jgi:nucleotide-binding universal stress UspA family protein